jgi:hypothetical protein
MPGAVIDSFLALTTARSGADVIALCEADPRLLDPELDARLGDAEDDLLAEGLELDVVRAFRLVLRSVREGRNLFASVYELFDAPSARAVRDLAITEPLLLDPTIDALVLRIERAARQQGQQELSEFVQSRRWLLARLRAHGPVRGYFDLLVDQLSRANSDRLAELRRENADLKPDFHQYALEQGRIAAQLGHHDWIQQLQFAAAMLFADDVAPGELVADATLGDSFGRLVGVLLGTADPRALRQVLLDAPEMLSPVAVIAVSALLRSEVDRASLERDVVRVRQLWVLLTLVQRCADIGARDALDELDRGVLWPQPTEVI